MQNSTRICSKESGFDAKWPEDHETSLPLNLITWLQMAQLHCCSYSAEDQICLTHLVRNLPDYTSASPEEQNIFKRIESLVANKKWDRNLSPDSGKVLINLVQQFWPGEKYCNSKVKRTISFSSATGES